MSIEVQSVRFSYGNRDVLKDVTFHANPGDIVALLGPNGVGKSTLFRCMMGFLHPQQGHVSLGGKDVLKLDRIEAAREIAYIPQAYVPAFNYTVLETALMGFTNKLGLFQAPNQSHRDEAMHVLDSLGIADLANRGCGRVSGGERQLVLLARALLQSANVLIMDEPTANLDYGNSYKVMERISNLASDGYTILFSTHEPNQAYLHATRVLVLKDGRILADGDSRTALTERTLSELYNLRVAVREVNFGNGDLPVSMPIGSKYA